MTSEQAAEIVKGIEVIVILLVIAVAFLAGIMFAIGQKE
jgi:hypothetical protein